MDAALATDTLQARLAPLEERFPQGLAKLPSGARVALREAGRRGAPAIVLLHGISSGAASWLQVAEAIGERAHVIAWDAPGYGHSTPLDGSVPSAGDYAQRLHELLQLMEIEHCTLVGHSLGALMADAFARGPAASHMERMVLISPAAGYGAPGQEEAQARVRRDRRAALDQLGVAGIAARIDQRLLSPAASESQREWVRWNASRLNAPGYLQAVEMLCTSSLGTGGACAAPVEVHCGEADLVTTPAACGAVAARLGTTCHHIANAGHASPVEQPEAIARLLLRGL